MCVPTLVGLTCDMYVCVYCMHAYVVYMHIGVFTCTYVYRMHICMCMRVYLCVTILVCITCMSVINMFLHVYIVLHAYLYVCTSPCVLYILVASCNHCTIFARMYTFIIPLFSRVCSQSLVNADTSFTSTVF